MLTELLKKLRGAGRRAASSTRAGTPHEAGIRDVFGGRVSFDGQAPVFDAPLLIVAFTNRSGSNLLADYLAQTRKVAGLGEFLNADAAGNMAKLENSQSLPDYMRFLVGHFVKDGQQLGVKASAEQLDFLIRWRILDMFPRVSVIHIHRDDILGQAVSHWIANNTGQWTSRHDAKTVDIPFDADAMLKIAQSVARSDEAIRITTAVHDMAYASVSYEEMLHDPRGVVGRISKTAGFDLGDWTPRTPQISKQAGGLNAEFLTRLRAQAAPLIQGAGK